MQAIAAARRAWQRARAGALALDVWMTGWTDCAAPQGSRTAWGLAVLGLAGAALVFYRLGAAAVCERNEAMEGLFVRRMIEAGEWLFPQVSGQGAMFKPPLFHWTAVGLAAVLGLRRASEFAVRLPSAIYGLAALALTMGMARRRLGAHAALLAGLILLGSYQFVAAARFGRVDMTLAFCESLALFAFAAWWTPGDAVPPPDAATRRRWHYLCALGLGLAVLAKGPVGLVLPLLAMALFVASERRWRDGLALAAPGPVALALLLATGWYALCLLSGHYEVLSRQLGSENAGRLFGALGSMPSWYYVRPILLNSLPLSLLVPFAVAAALRPGASAAGERALTRLLAYFWVATVVVLSLAAYKRRAYLVPLWPASAVLLAWYLCAYADTTAGQARRGAVTAVAAGLIVFNLLYIPHADIRACAGDAYRRVAVAVTQQVPSSAPLYAYGVAVPPQLSFYLDRPLLPLTGRIEDAAGWVLMPRSAWPDAGVPGLLPAQALDADLLLVRPVPADDAG
ncbi:MAG: glycosyltransferase family 39 protein [bacterium]